MRLLPTMTALLTAAATLATVPAYAQSCQQLWVERNQYYKRHGYCFKTPRAIQYFGNGGCRINSDGAVPFTAAERTRIDQIVRQERAMRCPA